MSTKNIIYLLVILVIAGFFRFYNLEKRGLFDWDEGYYVELTKTYRAGFDYFIKSKLLGQNAPPLSEYLLNNGGTFQSVFKDGFTYFSVFTSFIFGMTYNTILYSNALIGVLTVILLYVFLSKISDYFSAFIIALGLAVSPYHIAYSRSGYSVIFSAFFLLVSIYLYSRSLSSENKHSILLLNGLSLSAAFSCHYVVGIFVFIIFGIEIYYSFFNLKKPARFLWLAGSFLVPLFVLEAISRVVKYFITIKLNNLTDSYHFVSYFERGFRQFFEAAYGPAIRDTGAFYYLYSLLSQEGILITFFIALSLCLLFLKKSNSFKNIALGIIIIVSFLFVSLVNYKADRMFLIFLPLFYLLIGFSRSHIRAVVLRRVFIIIFFAAIIINMHRSSDFFNYRSNFDKAVNFMRNNKGVKHISDDMYVSRAYAGRQNSIDDFVSLDENEGVVSLGKIKGLFKNGYRYLVTYDKPYHNTNFMEAALTLKPDFMIASTGNNNKVYSRETCLLRQKKDIPTRYIYVYTLDRVIKVMQDNYPKIKWQAH
ncbi:MAG: hypothetical protein FJZ11_00075 [Candidatus Omnitrophica bacterium]|nr:hypothetical protein [Candidatus Omnitrophota bacterium]